MSEEAGNWDYFERGVLHVFDNWSVLRLAVAEEFAGRSTLQKANDFVVSILEDFQRAGAKFHSAAVEEALKEGLSELNIDLDDDAEIKEISEILIKLYKDSVGAGDHSFARNILETHCALQTPAPRNVERADSSTSESGPDEDGWITVKRK